jgi:curved DNA-binding protein CbpA
VVTGRSPIPDPYAVLGISHEASSAEISRAYRRLARGLHPDSRPADPGAAEQLRAVIAAHELLSDPGRRAAYDRRSGHRAFSPARDAGAGAAPAGAAAQLHPLEYPGTYPAPLPRPGGPVRAGPVRAGPVRVEPPARPAGTARDDLTAAAAERQLLQLIIRFLRPRPGRGW